MGPSCRSRRPNSLSRNRPLLRKHHLQNFKNQETSASSLVKPFFDSSEVENLETVENKADNLSCNSLASACSTPKAERFRIPDIRTCPPPPKKRRKAAGNACSLRKTRVAFFAPPDIDLFFYFALRGIQV